MQAQSPVTARASLSHSFFEILFGVNSACFVRGKLQYVFIVHSPLFPHLSPPFPLFPLNVFPEDWCDVTKKPTGAWTEYWWPKPGETEGSRKLTYGLSAKRTPYVVNAGIYDDKATIAEVSKLSAK